MNKSLSSKRRALLASCALAVSFVGLAAEAAAQTGSNTAPVAPLRLRSDYFGWGASVSPRVGFSDNIELAPKGLEKSSLISSVQFSGGAIVSRRRFTGVISGDVDVGYLSGANKKFAVNQRVGATSTTTIADDLLYLDVSGSSSRQLLGENARFSANQFGARGQQVNVNTYSVSPYIFRKFEDGSRAGLRYRFSQVYFGDRNADANPTRSNLLNNSSTQEVSASYQSAQLFQRLRFVASAYANRTIEDGSTFSPRFQYEQATGQVSAEYALTDRFSLSGAVGYDEVDTSSTATAGVFDDNALSGVFWRAGFTARPGRKTFLRAEYGRRYGKDFVSGEFTYNFSDRLQFRAGADRRFETRAQTVGSQFAEVQSDTLEFIDRLREGAALDPRELIDTANRFSRLRDGAAAQSVGIGAFDTAYAGVRGKWGRTEIGGTANYERADFGFRRVDSWGGQIDVSRQLSRRLSAYGGAFYRHSETDFDPALCVSSPFLFGFDVRAPLFNPTVACQQYRIQSGRTDTIGGRVGAKYRIYENLSLFGEYTRTHRLGEFSSLEYKENSFLAGATLDF